MRVLATFVAVEPRGHASCWPRWLVQPCDPCKAPIRWNRSLRLPIVGQTRQSDLAILVACRWAVLATGGSFFRSGFDVRPWEPAFRIHHGKTRARGAHGNTSQWARVVAKNQAIDRPIASLPVKHWSSELLLDTIDGAFALGCWALTSRRGPRMKPYDSTLAFPSCEPLEIGVDANFDGC